MDSNEFNQPSAVLVAPNGDIFVGDGHGGESNARIVKFSADGSYVIKAWGRKKDRRPASSKPRMDSQWTPADGSSSPTARTIGCRVFDQEGNFPGRMDSVRPAERYFHRSVTMFFTWPIQQSDDGDKHRRGPNGTKESELGALLDGRDRSVHR